MHHLTFPTLFDWLNDWLIDRSIDWLIDWLIDYWLIDWMIDWSTDWLIDWLIDWWIDWLVDCIGLNQHLFPNFLQLLVFWSNNFFFFFFFKEMTVFGPGLGIVLLFLSEGQVASAIRREEAETRGPGPPFVLHFVFVCLFVFLAVFIWPLFSWLKKKNCPLWLALRACPIQGLIWAVAWVPTPPSSQKQNGGNKMGAAAQRRETERFAHILADDEGFCLIWAGGSSRVKSAHCQVGLYQLGPLLSRPKTNSAQN